MECYGARGKGRGRSMCITMPPSQVTLCSLVSCSFVALRVAYDSCTCSLRLANPRLLLLLHIHCRNILLNSSQEGSSEEGSSESEEGSSESEEGSSD